MFCTNYCFSDSHLIFFRKSQKRPLLLPSKPFIKNLGQVCFDVRSIALRSGRIYRKIEYFLTGRKEYWETGAKIIPIKDDYYDDTEGFGYKTGDIFGYNPLLDDERMNFLYFELHKPLFIRAVSNNTTLAQGKIFVHLYPSGYVNFLVALSINVNKVDSEDDLRNVIRETRPSGMQDWRWDSRLGKLKLSELCNLVQELTCKSILQKPIYVREGKWQSFTRIHNLDENINAEKLFFKGKIDKLDISSKPNTEQDEVLISSSQGELLLLQKNRHRGRALHLNWKFYSIFEYISLLEFIYKDYKNFLRSETTKLKDFRHNLSSKIDDEELFKFTVYDQHVLKYIQALDNHIHTTTGFYRRIFSSYWNGRDFGRQKESLREEIGAWENEIENWDHSIVAVYKKMIAPFRAFFGF